jgi:hypothetical protein
MVRRKLHAGGGIFSVRRTRGPFRTLVVAMVALTIRPVATLAAQAGSVSGIVYDSIAEAPLADAAVFLWGTPYKAISDANGRYRIDGVPPGEYSLLFFHTRLGEMGLSPGPHPITLGGGDERLGIELATPSMRTMVTTECLMEAPPPGSGIVAGRVKDGESDLRLGGSDVTLTWNVRDTEREESLAMRTDPLGWYYTCSAPRDVPIVASASFYGRESHRREVSLGADGFTEVDFAVFPLDPSSVAGRLLDASTGRPVDQARVWLRGTTLRASTNRDGRFDLGEVVPGTYMLVTDHLSYGEKMDTLEVPSGLELRVEMLLDTRPIEIAPITVTVDRRAPISAGMGGGIVITREDIEPIRQRSRDASDVIRSLHVPGVIVRHHSNGTICVGYSTGQVKMLQTGCVEMVIYINDVRATDPDLALRVSPDAIERMVIYKPVEASNLFGLGGASGVWMIYTRGN